MSMDILEMAGRALIAWMREVANLAEQSDWLAGMLLTDMGWIARFSKAQST